MTPQERARYVEKDMLLPDGKTCSQCARYQRCKVFISCPPDNIHCDWSPSAFIEAANRRDDGGNAR